MPENEPPLFPPSPEATGQARAAKLASTTKRASWEQYNWLFGIGFTLVITALFLSFTRGLERFEGLFSVEWSPHYVSRLLAAILLVVVLGLAFFWLAAVRGELKMLRFYLEDHCPPQPGGVFVWLIAFSLLLGLLAYYSNRVLVFAAMMVVYSLGDLWGQWFRDNEIVTLHPSARNS